MTSTLLDVNVLVALFEEEHIHHQSVHRWFAHRGFAAQPGPVWTSCPLTVNGCVRVLCRSRFGAPRLTPSNAAGRLRRFCQSTNHEFWQDDLSLLDESRFHLTHAAGPKQLTDAYLLALAVSRGQQFATLDRSIAWSAVAGATADALVVLGNETT